jgi:iron-sulfur cluster assembly protein
MLVLTDNATIAVTSITSDLADAPEAGLRIAVPEDSDQGFTLAIVPAPEPTDTIVESAGARVFLEPTVAEVLEDRTLDAEVGSDGAVRFALRHPA